MQRMSDQSSVMDLPKTSIVCKPIMMVRFSFVADQPGRAGRRCPFRGIQLEVVYLEIWQNEPNLDFAKEAVA